MPATRADLDAAIEILAIKFNAAITDLLAKVAAGQVATPEDFAAELEKIQAMSAKADAADPGSTATPATPTDTVNPTVTIEPNA